MVLGDFNPPLIDHTRKNTEKFSKGTEQPQSNMVTMQPHLAI